MLESVLETGEASIRLFVWHYAFTFYIGKYNNHKKKLKITYPATVNNMLYFVSVCYFSEI